MKPRSASEVADALECYRMKSERQRKNCKNKACRYNNNDPHYGFWCCSNSILHDAIALLKEQGSIIKSLESDLHETLEVVSGRLNVVRCKDCRNKECEGRDGFIVCDITGESHKPDFFCADGERRDG